MPLLDRTGAIADLWPRIGAEDALPQQGRALVDLPRLAEALETPLTLGVHLGADADPAALVPHFPRLDLVSVDFPSFADGRGFSLARMLRRLGWTGRLRASGPVIADQFAYLLDCGFDEVAVPDGLAARQPVEHWMAQARSIPLGYQRGLHARGSILDRRVARD